MVIVDALDREHVARVLAVMNKYAALAAQAMSEMNARQTQLDLESIFRPAVMVSSAGREESLRKLATLAQLFDQYRKFHARYTVQFNSEFAACGLSLPEEKRSEAMRRAVSKVQEHLDEQALFYRLRENWMESVRKLIELFSSARSSISLDGEQLLFEDDEVLEEFGALMAGIDEIATAEQALMQRRVMSLAGGAATLGMATI